MIGPTELKVKGKENKNSFNHFFLFKNIKINFSRNCINLNKLLIK